MRTGPIPHHTTLLSPRRCYHGGLYHRRGRRGSAGVGRVDPLRDGRFVQPSPTARPRILPSSSRDLPRTRRHLVAHLELSAPGPLPWRPSFRSRYEPRAAGPHPTGLRERSPCLARTEPLPQRNEGSPVHLASPPRAAGGPRARDLPARPAGLGHLCHRPPGRATAGLPAHVLSW